MDGVIGTILLFGANWAPRNWALCHGQLLAIAQYQSLFSIIGTTYGGDGRTTFALPDLRGRVPAGYGQGPGSNTNYQLGQRVGAETTQLTQANLPAGGGRIAVSEEPPSVEDPNGAVLAAGNFYAPASTAAGGSSLGGIAGGGSSAPVNNLQPTLMINYVICLQGIYPSRS